MARRHSSEDSRIVAWLRSQVSVPQFVRLKASRLLLPRCDPCGHPARPSCNVLFTREMLLTVAGEIKTPFMLMPSATVYVVYERGQGNKGYGLVSPVAVEKADAPPAVPEDGESLALLLDREFPDPGTDN